MQDIDKSILRELINTKTEPAVTIYVPMHVSAAPPHISENQIRLKNLMRRAAEKVRHEYKHSSLPASLEKAVSQLHDNLGFWEEQKPGLLICASESQIQMFHLPIDTEEYVAIDAHFHLAPVIGLLHDEHEFYLLALAQHDPKLYKGSLLYGLEPVRARLPANPKEALSLDETKKSTEDRVRFFRLLDKAVSNAINDRLPLILAGTETDVAEYRELSRYHYILNEAIHGNHALDNPRLLFEMAARIIRCEIVAPEHRSIANEYRQINGANPDKTSHDPASIIEAAEEGRIDKLLTRLSRQTADNVQDSDKDMPRITFPQSESDNKQLNEVALSVWNTSGMVLNLQPDEMPEATLMAARLRY